MQDLIWDSPSHFSTNQTPISTGAFASQPSLRHYRIARELNYA
jgi:hypothetical protein